MWWSIYYVCVCVILYIRVSKAKAQKFYAETHKRFLKKEIHWPIQMISWTTRKSSSIGLISHCSISRGAEVSAVVCAFKILSRGPSSFHPYTERWRSPQGQSQRQSQDWQKGSRYFVVNMKKVKYGERRTTNKNWTKEHDVKTKEWKAGMIETICTRS